MANTVYSGLAVDELAWDAISSGKQSMVLMPFQCRAIPKQGIFFVLTRPPVAPVTPAQFFSGMKHNDMTPRLVGSISFISNRRLDEAKVLQLGQSLPHSFPADDTELQLWRRKFGKEGKDTATNKKLHWIAWEIQFCQKIQPIRLQQLRDEDSQAGDCQHNKPPTAVCAYCRQFSIGLLIAESCVCAQSFIRFMLSNECSVVVVMTMRFGMPL